ncbi:GNAT family N-acetyltransferase [Candidatus Babeliales bacterium]|nr:GNAT family N-acetyltransferase [Candidatus Babeliales bacterium]MCF7899744.1 GNAT family N-acetyltransferase [Candidatus Babeliales bacterium]
MNKKLKKEKKSKYIFKCISKFCDNLVLECHEINKFDDLVKLGKEILPIYSQAFADNINSLLDSNFQIKQEFLKFYEKISSDFREKLEEQRVFAFEQKENLINRINSTRDYVLQLVENGLLEGLFYCEPVIIFLKNKENKILGFALFLRKYPNSENILKFPKNLVPAVEFGKESVYLHHLAILPEFQGKGLARPLIFSILELMPKIKKIILDTDFWNTKSQSIYKKFGFNEIGRRSYDQVAIFEYIKD